MPYAPRLVVIDFETEAIQPLPAPPPKPVGLAIKSSPDGERYLAWGHPTGNNCTRQDAERELRKIWDSGAAVVMHNAKFDLGVAYHHFGLLPLPWNRVHDTMLLLFLRDPHALTLSLKPAAELWLGEPPTEQDAVKDWLVDHGIITKAQSPGAFISQAPGYLVGAYAIGDVSRTARLFDLHYHYIQMMGMGAAYDRERRLMPILMANEKQGLCVDVDRLAYELQAYEQALQYADRWLRRKLKAPGLNLDADAEVAVALKASGIVKHFAKTKTGRDSTSKKNLTADKFSDPEVFAMLGYRNRLQTVLANSMRPWLAMAQGTGRIHTEWNQVRQAHGNDGTKGTRSGRLSCSRFQNISKAFDGFTPPKAKALPPLPLVRKYIIPDPGGVFCHADYNQQEFRILAHYEDDGLQAAYKANPRIDYHDNMRDLIKNIAGIELDRRPVKILNFGINYGMGLGKLAQALGVDVTTAKRIRDAQKRAAPGVAALDAELKRRGRCGEYIRTWGGRVYYCEPPKIIDGENRSFEYKLLNYLIQGSAADCTKEAIVRYHEAKFDSRFLVTVHDEINISTEAGREREALKELQGIMEGVEFDVPMLTDAKVGPSWGDLKGFKP